MSRENRIRDIPITFTILLFFLFTFQENKD